MGRFGLIFITILAVISMAVTAFAVPLLQLDIVGGTYDWSTESIVIDKSTPFSLVALLTTDNTSYYGYNYQVSIALTPKETIGGNFGSMIFNGQTINVTGDMTYGDAPVNALAASKNLPPHDVFKTYYYEYNFVFDPNNTFLTYNTQTGIAGVENGKVTYKHEFWVDARGVAGDFNVHFDLYNFYDIKAFAPFSHDAETVPEPNSLLLLGVGLIGIAGFGRRCKV